MKESTPCEQHRVVRSEYEALRGLYCAAAMLEAMIPAMERRMKLVPGAWQKLKSAEGMLVKALKSIEETVPDADRRKLKHDLDNTEMYMRTKGAAAYSVDDEDFVYMTRNEMKAVMRFVCEPCNLCDKTGKDVTRCKRRKAINALLNFAVPEKNGEECLWVGYSTEARESLDYAVNATWEDVEE